MTSQISRLDRQVILLETGSTQAVRNMAADQLGDLAKLHPEDTLSLLSRVYPFLLAKKWETRTTAARAVGGIVSHAPAWDPNSEDGESDTDDSAVSRGGEADAKARDNPKVTSDDGVGDGAIGVNGEHVTGTEDDGVGQNAKVKIEQEMQLKLEELDDSDEWKSLQDDSDLFSLFDWNLGEVLKTGKTLLASSIHTFPASEAPDPPQKLAKTEESGKLEENVANGSLEAGAGAIPPLESKKSARMMAMAKRKRKIQARTTTKKPVDLSQSSISRNLLAQEDSSQSPTPSPSGLANAKLEITEQTDKKKIMVESMVTPLLEKHEKISGLVWQFQGIYELLLENLMNDAWEIRHGAALGLREIMKKHAKSVARIKGKLKEQNDRRNQRALEDLATRLLTVFALDRFGDFVYDTVVAPVRESAAQTLAALLLHLNDELSVKIFGALEQLVLQDPRIVGLPTKIWEATHGGLLGIRYFVSIKTDFLFRKGLLNNVVNIVLYGLKEPDDDVQSVAAAILTPITSEFVKLEASTVDLVLTTIWSSLTHLEDDLSSSVGSVMDLLAKLCQHQEVLDVLKAKAFSQPLEWSFKSLVPKLYPFLRHSITNVRIAVLNLLQAFLSIKDDFSKLWINGKVFRLIFQNILLEQNPSVLQMSFDVYVGMLSEFKVKNPDKDLDHLFGKHLAPILHLLITPIGEQGKSYNMELQYILKPSPHYQLHSERKRNSSMTVKSDIPPPANSERVNIDAPMLAGDITLLGTEVIVNTRTMAAKALGITLSMFQETTLKSFFSNVLLDCLKLPYATPRLLVAVIISEFCINVEKNFQSTHAGCPAFLAETFGPLLSEGLSDPSTFPPFRELVPSLKALRTQCQSLLSTFVDVGMLPPQRLPQLAIIVQGESEAGPEAFGIKTAEKVYGEISDKLFKHLSNSYKILTKKPLEDAKYRVLQAIETAKEVSRARYCSILANYACAILQFSGLPTKLNSFIRALMDSIKEEKYSILRQRSGDAIKTLVVNLVQKGKSNVANKIVKNLCGFLCVDTSEVPEFGPNFDLRTSILTLRREQNALAMQEDARAKKLAEDAHIKREGAMYTLSELLIDKGEKVLELVPQINQSIFEPLQRCDLNFDETENVNTKGQEVVDALGILRALFVYMHPSLQEREVLPRLPALLKFLRSDFAVLRYSAARTFADLATVLPLKIIPFIIREALPLMNNPSSVTDRQGLTELVYHLSQYMGSDILPYVVFLIVPLLGRMSDANQDVRTLATTTFASIIKLVPLEAGIPDPEGMPSELLEGRERERDFLQQMMDPSKAKPFKCPVAIKTSLRKYQQDGVNWLAFLNKYHLHGILCDDMGLGKTLQTICIIASDQYLRHQNYEASSAVESRPLPSLIVCPPSLTGHWEQEFEQYAPFLKVLIYAGGPSMRFPLRHKLDTADIVVTSYDVARNDIDVITKYDFNYCVLDEGHIIKNAQSKLSKAVKLVQANHRLILTGTPIQNNVVELWSLFDFLMPGFLGTEKMFHERFAKPVAASRNSKTSSKEQEAGALALDALHKQVLPFMLRRLKEDVLSDLPPKIIQDYYCELSDLQKQLYKDFAKKQKHNVERDIEHASDVENKQHIFQALQYMRKLCNHPSLVLSPSHPQWFQVQEYLKQTGLSMHDLSHAPKLGALQNLLLECGIGTEDLEKKSKGDLPSMDNVISQHRALIFCQLKDMLDMVENDLFKKYMPSVTYMRLDGSVESRDRQALVRKFNEDPSIDCLLLTTKVGGLGLNLTGADTVIFVEHDWNPMNDLQAMDRAHRIGQKKVVNVYRIITKGTLEEKIMGLQKFKMNIASTVINQQNSGLASMDTHQLLDLFDADNVPSQEAEEGTPNAAKNGKMDDIANESGLTGKAKEAVGELKELWDSSQYEEEYNLDNFIKTLH
ncbi:LAMI_0E07470g1_1 [Lachancea mirantina]|uniref:TATA-binding protein-associated factor mot1 n=1 Tax=Lachancea mirantina TaxID=1230905 RepID=A0A1G4JMN2_9SACH|nr:LAMI_0E07470g1_1 [Lachancea mirantina]